MRILPPAKTVLRWSMLILLPLWDLSEHSGVGGCEAAGDGAWRSLVAEGIGHAGRGTKTLRHAAPFHLAPPPLALGGGAKNNTTKALPRKSKERNGKPTPLREAKNLTAPDAKNQTAKARRQSKDRNKRNIIRQAKHEAASKKAKNDTASALNGLAPHHLG